MPKAVVRYPESAWFTTTALRTAFARVLPEVKIATALDDSAEPPELQFCDVHAAALALARLSQAQYDLIDWDVVARYPNRTLVNAYAIRKALCRKNHLAHTVASHVAKRPDSILARAVPTTFSFSLSHADELDELWADELYGLELDGRWFVLKAALADRGQGIRLFSSREELEDILAEFEALDDSSAEEDEGDDADDVATGGLMQQTGVSLSSLREFVIQVRWCGPAAG